MDDMAARCSTVPVLFSAAACPFPSTTRGAAANSLSDLQPKTGTTTTAAAASVLPQPASETTMPALVSPLRDVFTAREIARAAGAAPDDVRALMESGQIATIDGSFIGPAEAVRAVRLLQGAAERLLPDRPLFQPRPAAARKAGMPAVASGGLHLGLLGVIAFMTALGLRSEAVKAVEDPKPVRLVFLVRPGPGGGGGGGGLRQ